SRVRLPLQAELSLFATSSSLQTRTQHVRQTALSRVRLPLQAEYLAYLRRGPRSTRTHRGPSIPQGGNSDFDRAQNDPSFWWHSRSSNDEATPRTRIKASQSLGPRVPPLVSATTRTRPATTRSKLARWEHRDENEKASPHSLAALEAGARVRA